MALVILLASPLVEAQWTITNPHPPSALCSCAYAVSGSRQSGLALCTSETLAEVWSGCCFVRAAVTECRLGLCVCGIRTWSRRRASLSLSGRWEGAPV